MTDRRRECRATLQGISAQRSWAGRRRRPISSRSSVHSARAGTPAIAHAMYWTTGTACGAWRGLDERWTVRGVVGWDLVERAGTRYIVYGEAQVKRSVKNGPDVPEQIDANRRHFYNVNDTHARRRVLRVCGTAMCVRGKHIRRRCTAELS